MLAEFGHGPEQTVGQHDAYAANEIPPRPTYKQDWVNYNKAQTSEKRLFCGLLADLCGTIPEPVRTTTRGRPPVPVADAIFSTAYKVYSGFSGRRFTTDLQNAVTDGHTGHAPHFNVVLRTLEDEATTPILVDLVTKSALPMTAIESDFAIDSSGFSSNRFIKYFDVKHGTERRKADWVKTHIACGVRTNVVTAVAIGDGHDGNYFPELLAKTAEGFTIREVSADKAYTSRKNLELVEKLGGKAYLPLKSGARPDKNGEAWRRLFHEFSLHRDEFCRHYHKRSNVESTFSMIKRKFGDSVKAKTETAMKNEVLAKLVCHNVVVCIHEMFEMGIEVGFGGSIEPESQVELPWTVKFPMR